MTNQDLSYLKLTHFLELHQMVSLIIILLWKLRTYKLKKEKVMRMLCADLEYTRRMAVQLKSTRIMVITIKFSNNCFALNLTVVTLLYQVPFQLREVITFDSGFWNDILPKLESFYFNHLFPELVYPRIFHGEMRWNKVLEFPRSL